MGQAWSSSAKVSEVAGTQHHSSFAAGVKVSSRKAAELPLKVFPISVWSLSAQNASPSPPTRGDVGDDHFEAKGGEDSLLTNVELATGAVSSILRNSDLKRVETLLFEKALALSLQGTVSVCLSAFFYSFCRCVNVICKLHLIPWQTATYIKDLTRRASSVESSAKAARAYKTKVASLTSERAELRDRIQSLTNDVLGYKSDLKHTSTAKEKVEDRENKAIEGLRSIEDELQVVKEEFQAAREELCTKAAALDRAR